MAESQVARWRNVYPSLPVHAPLHQHLPVGRNAVVAVCELNLDVRLGEDKGDPQFVVTDLLPHLAKEQSKRTLSEGIKGEELNL